MNPEDFSAFFKAVHKYMPFPWQRNLVSEVAARGWPEALPLPTSAGKTSVMDVAVFCLALQAGLPRRTAALRTFFVVDRRLVVDDATAHAQKLAAALLAPDTPILAEVTNRLLSFGGAMPLRIVKLRGGMFRDPSWIRNPSQPTLLVTTVDQVGSRLLFRGYGVSDRQKPVHAALTACDAFYLVDEAHISAPFVETLRAVSNMQTERWVNKPVCPPLGVVVMSATLNSGEAARKFMLTVDDWEDPVLKRRLQADKIAELRQAGTGEKQFQAAMASAAGELAVGCGGSGVVGVVVNRVNTARGVFDQLRKDKKVAAVLLTGRVRPFDRDRLLKTWLPFVRAQEREPLKERMGPLYVVATQTVEVGADLDFDTMTTESAPLGSLRQRFGRLDRLGKHQSCKAIVLHRQEEGDAKKLDPVYGADTNRTWEWLSTSADENGTVNFGIAAMDRLAAEFPPPALDPGPGPPALLPAFVDLFAQTKPRPTPEPEPAPFLHGFGSGDPAEVEIVWRVDIAPGEETDWPCILRLTPPLSRESLSVPVWEARRWLQGKAKGELPDVDAPVPDDYDSGTISKRPFVRWRGSEDVEIMDDPADIRPGDVVAVPAAYGGADEFGWDPLSTKPVSDVVDLCAMDAAEAGAARRMRLRLHPEPLRLLADAGGQLSEDAICDLLRLADEDLEDDERDDAYSRVLDWLMQLGQQGPRAVELLRRGTSRRIEVYPDKKGVVVSILCPPVVAEEEDVMGEPEKENDSYPEEITLERHCRDVARWAGKLAEKCGLERNIAHDLEAAGILHDLGKADLRFQALLRGGDWLSTEASGRLVAKGTVPHSASMDDEKVRRVAGYPKGMRHEMVSAGLLLAEGILESVDALDPELIVSLVGTHHGFGRDIPHDVSDPHGFGINGTVCGLALRDDTRDAMHRVWRLWPELRRRLNARYGWWGLAYLEALLRMADWRASREEETC
ncbi:MAG TPA: type I-U CRISPR-associated helicase/endonuclease Cas3 [Spirochaetia bacterium]|nr:type I-U CRISPR-associated helicase/endonuclease Cas3 [Spirochaetia bacterium]